MSTFHYIIRRLLYVIPIIAGVSLIVFLLFNVAAGDPTPVLLGKHATFKQMAEMRHELGLDKPMIVQYFDILKSAFTFDFGRSWKSKQCISHMIKSGAYVSLTYTVPAFLFASIAAVAIAICVAFFYNSLLDRSLVVVCVLMMSIPGLAYILFGQWFLSYKMGLFPISGYEHGFPDFIPYVLLPVMIIIVQSIGPDVRLYRTIMLEEMHQDYVRTAKAKGLKNGVILFKHVLKNAMIPIITSTVLQIPSLILGVMTIENFFSIPGLGNITVQAVNNSDFPVIKAMTVLGAVLCIVFNVIVDFLHTMVDPRIRFK